MDDVPELPEAARLDPFDEPQPVVESVARTSQLSLEAYTFPLRVIELRGARPEIVHPMRRTWVPLHRVESSHAAVQGSYVRPLRDESFSSGVEPGSERAAVEGVVKGRSVEHCDRQT